MPLRHRLSLVLVPGLFLAACSTPRSTDPTPVQSTTRSPSTSSTANTSAPATAPATKPVATVAAPKTGNAAFFEKHESFLARGKEGPIGVLFLGDSITEQWKKVPEIWEKYYGRYRAANFGIGGDQTQHVLWRIENGELEGINPKVVVLMIGTNNSAANSGAEIAAANRIIVGKIQEKLPRTKILLLAIFPRDARPNEDWQKRITAIRHANAELARLDNGRTVRFLDLGPKFLGADGSIPDELMPDQLHLSPQGYQIWAESMQPLLEEMLAN